MVRTRAASLALNRPPLRLEGFPHSTLVPLLHAGLSSDWLLIGLTFVNALPIGVNPFSNIVVDLCVDGSFADCLALDWSSLGLGLVD